MWGGGGVVAYTDKGSTTQLTCSNRRRVLVVEVVLLT